MYSEIIYTLLSILFHNFTLCVLLTFLCVILFWKYIRIYYYLSKIPGPKGWPIIGNAILLAKASNLQMYSKLLKENGTFFKVWIGPIAAVCVTDPHILQTVFKAPGTLNRGWVFHWLAYSILKDSILITTNLAKWKRIRKTFNCAFGPTILNSFIPIFNSASESLNAELKNEVRKTQPFDVRNNLRRAALSSIFTAALGVDSNNLPVTESSYSQAVDIVVATCFERILKLWTYPQFIFDLTTSGKKQKENLNFIWHMTNQVLDEKLKSVGKITTTDEYKNVDQPVGKNPLKKPFLDFILDMIQIHHEFTIEQLKEELNSLILAAYETTPATLGYLFIALGARQDIQQRVYDETYRIFGDSERPVELEDLSELKYTEMVIKETLRLYPAVAHTGREISDDIDLENYKIPAGTHVLVPIYETHRNPEHWYNPTQFNPERFLHNHHPYAYIPFGVGLRNCVGAKYAMMLMKIITANTLRKYQIYTPLKLDQLNVKMDLGLKLTDGHLITVKERSKQVDSTTSSYAS